MTAAELRDQVQKEYHEGQTVTIWLSEGERGSVVPATVKIIKFNPSSVLVERRGFKESYTYWDWIQKIKGEGKHKVNLPERLKKKAAG